MNASTDISHSVEEILNIVNKITGNNQNLKTELSDLRSENSISGGVANVKKIKPLLR